jgi:hypothetical protein
MDAMSTATQVAVLRAATSRPHSAWCPSAHGKIEKRDDAKIAFFNRLFATVCVIIATDAQKSGGTVAHL